MTGVMWIELFVAVLAGAGLALLFRYRIGGNTGSVIVGSLVWLRLFKVTSILFIVALFLFVMEQAFTKTF